MARGRKPTKKATAQTKRKLKQETNMDPEVKIEQDALAADFPIFPGFFDHDQDAEGQEEFVAVADSLSLKGQVWPGMGKMDLANDEMRRTRNQRKPKSVIDKMKRASEGIVPTQVIMTPDFKVERVKDVYDDSSSPIPGQEESTPPRKVPKPRRKKATPLTEVSVNVPKQRRNTTRGPKSNTGKRAEVKPTFDRQDDSGTATSPFHFRHGHDVFRDDDGHLGPFGGQTLSSTLNDRRFDLRDRHGVRSMNTTHSNLVSPTPLARDLPRHFSSRDGTSTLRPESYPAGSFGHIEATYAMKDASIYNASSRLPFTVPAHNQFHGISQDHFRFSSSNAFHMKQEDYPGSMAGDSTPGTNDSPFTSISGVNPLFSQDRLFLNSYSQGSPTTPFSTLSFSPINRPRERSQSARDVKPATHLCEVMDGNDLCDVKTPVLDGTWHLHPSNHELDFPDGRSMGAPAYTQLTGKPRSRSFANHSFAVWSNLATGSLIALFFIGESSYTAMCMRRPQCAQFLHITILTCIPHALADLEDIIRG
ncbi:hypothetical protein CDV36_005731 [Fusarium kuroshium]|uniref:Uncharacterized protein n=2 Tax=Fusarium solani species complex TaxID=232080 RepID=A0A3M2SBP4_9HYPO|nr:hypothetical protein CDV36_005731 [Fusarium kuroshium]RSM15604.1 hypothetical protein CEP52_000631 [Fusarium oligoseptatum]